MANKYEGMFVHSYHTMVDGTLTKRYRVFYHQRMIGEGYDKAWKAERRFFEWKHEER